MAAGLGYIEFTTGDVLTAAQANGYLASQVVMVFASSAARTSAIASPQEGMISYLKDTNSTEYYSGSAWVAIGGSAGALTLITSGTFTTSSTININDIFSSTYQNYKIFLDVSASSGNLDWTARLRVSGSDNTNSTYNSQGAFFDGSTGYVNFSAADKWYVGNCIGGVNALEMTIYSPNQTNQTKFGSTGGSTNRAFIHGGVFTATTSFTGLSLLTSSNNATGNYRVYGLANS